MTIDDKTIVQAIKEKTEEGFRLLMQKYKQPIYWPHTSFGRFAQ